MAQYGVAPTDGHIAGAVGRAVDTERCDIILIAATDDTRDWLACEAARIPSAVVRSCGSVSTVADALDVDVAAARERRAQRALGLKEKRRKLDDERRAAFAASSRSGDRPSTPRLAARSSRDRAPDDSQAYTPPPMPAELMLSDRHVEMLRDSGLTDATITEARLFTVAGTSGAEREWLARAVNWKSWPTKMGGALVFPMYWPGEPEPYAYRLRPDVPVTEKKKSGKTRARKYENPKSGPRCFYFGGPCDANSYSGESASTIYWTEGEKKALLMSQLGYQTVGLTGIAIWNETGTHKLSGAIRRHLRLDCDHVIVFDYPKHGTRQSDEAREMRKLAQALLDSGASRVRGLFVPDARAKGIDDYFGKHGEAATRALIDTAPEVDLGKVDVHLPGWQAELRANPNTDTALASIGNLECILRNDDRWYGRLAYNERAMRVEIAPGSPIQQPGDIGLRELSPDVDAARIASWLDREYELDVDPGSRKLLGAIATVAHERSYDPFRDWLAGLEWDGVPRLDTWLADYAGVKDTPLHRAFGAKFLISAVARTFKPGAKVDTVLVLEGPQGARKSQLLAALIPRGEWFSDDLPADLGGKDAKQHLLGKVLCELSELDALRRTGVETLKAFLSRSVDQYRPPYARGEVSQPRRVVFAATTNDAEYLTDSTGARRFWPARVGRCDVTELANVRDRLWAEARVRYERGELWWFDATDPLVRSAEAAQLARSAQDPWHDGIAEYAREAERSPGYLVMDEVLARLGVERRSYDGRAARRVVQVLSALGWTKQRPKIDGVRTWVYRPRALQAHDDDAVNDGFVG